MCRLWPIFPVRLQTSIFGTAELNFCVRNGNRWTLCVRKTDSLGFTKLYYVSADLFSRLVSKQVFSALQSLTSVFGMGTGGPSALEVLTMGYFKFKIQLTLSSKSSTLHSHNPNWFGAFAVVHLQGFEPGTHWLRVSCSTNWAKGANWRFLLGPSFERP